MPDDYEFFRNKRPDRTYISRAFRSLFSFDSTEPRKMRILSKVFDSDESHGFAEVKGEVVLRITPGGRQEVKVTFYEDPRGIECLTIQKYTIKSGKPHQLSFSFHGEQITKLYDLLRFVKYIRLEEDDKKRLDDAVFDGLLIALDELAEKRRFFLEDPDLVAEIVRNDITKSDVVAFGYRKRQLEIFEQLLNDEDFFEETRQEWSKKGKEAVWQQFFEDNTWIFGYGLNYIFTTGLDDKQLEQITTGYSVKEAGKRVDALMRTRGLISSLCFVEIKTHTTQLLSSGESYRAECWAISDELAGSIAQVQKTIQKAMKTLQTRLDFRTSVGDPTGESAFLYQPKAYVVIGSLGEFLGEHGINEEKFSSFELFRRHLVNPEVITYDELYERAKFIVRHSEQEAKDARSEEPAEDLWADDEIPF